MRAVRASIAFLAAGLLALAMAPIASADPSLPFVLTGSIDGSTTPDGSFNATSIAVNHATHHVLVLDRAHGAVVQLDESGNPVNFSGLGSPKRPIPSDGQVVVDNSGGATQGDFYVLHPNASVEGFSPAGTKLPGAWPILPKAGATGPLTSIAVDHEGNVWLSYANTNFTGPPYAEQIASNGSRTGKEIELVGAKYFSCACQTIEFDSHDNIYYGTEDNVSVYRRDADENYSTYRTLEGEGFVDMATDPSTNDIFTARLNSIVAQRYNDPYEKVPFFEVMPDLAPTALAFSGDGQTLFVAEGAKVSVFERQLPELPEGIGTLQFSGVKSLSGFVGGLVDTGGGAPATYYLEYATDAEYKAEGGKYTKRFPLAPGEEELPHTTFGPQPFSGQVLSGLEPDTVYHVRLAVTNAAGTGYGPDTLMKTLKASFGGGEDVCPNALARKQTAAQALPDCRAYELVSAGNTGGYDVESSLVPGQEPFPGFPDADGRALYGIHQGAIPGPWNPTNKGVDPYVAVRDAQAETWKTEYVGLPADQSPDKSSFSTVLGAADAGLHTFAFAGPGLCDPCFDESPETGIPVREPSGALVQGMVGANPSAGSDPLPEGRVAKMLSADGSHLVFGSKEALVAGANGSGGNLNIFDRNLTTKTTQLASTTTAGAAIQAGMGVSELDLSSDGARVVIGTKVSEDAAGNEYVKPYMHLGSSPDSVEVAPGASSGVLFDGMTSDGSKVFFTSSQELVGDDHDTAADVYEADVGPTGNVSLKLLTPSPGAACNPVANGAGAHWNVVGATADCSAVAIGGGAGVARDSGTVYLLSPEQLETGKGVLDQPNLYAVPAGGNPQFVATLSPDDPVVIDSVHDAAAPEGSELEVSPSGRFAVFRSTLPLTGVGNAGEPSVFLFDQTPAGGGEALVCPSCNPTLTGDPTLRGEATLARDGLSLTDDGRVFFNTPVGLGVEDTDGTLDVYEWVGGTARLISSGIGRFGSELLTTTHDGTDAFFFTHDTLDAHADSNGDRTKLYDARVGGGFFRLPVKPQCAASDECHGPGTETPPPPTIVSSGKTSQGNYQRPAGCPKGKVKRGKKCVRKPKHHRRHKTKGKKHHG